MPSVEIDLDDFYWECSSKDKKTLMEWLEEDGYYPKPEPIDFPKSQNYLDDEWEEIIRKLAMNRHMLSNEQIEYIKEIAKNFI
jgi:hypothetical protein